MESDMADDLGKLITQLSDFPENSTRAQFSSLFVRAQRALELDDYELAHLFRVSLPTIGRWARGETAPHPIGRQAVFQSLRDIAQARI